MRWIFQPEGASVRLLGLHANLKKRASARVLSELTVQDASIDVDFERAVSHRKTLGGDVEPVQNGTDAEPRGALKWAALLGVVTTRLESSLDSGARLAIAKGRATLRLATDTVSLGPSRATLERTSDVVRVAVQPEAEEAPVGTTLSLKVDWPLREGNPTLDLEGRPGSAERPRRKGWGSGASGREADDS